MHTNQPSTTLHHILRENKTEPRSFPPSFDDSAEAAFASFSFTVESRQRYSNNTFGCKKQDWYNQQKKTLETGHIKQPCVHKSIMQTIHFIMLCLQPSKPTPSATDCAAPACLCASSAFTNPGLWQRLLSYKHEVPEPRGLNWCRGVFVVAASDRCVYSVRKALLFTRYIHHPPQYQCTHVLPHTPMSWEKLLVPVLCPTSYRMSRKKKLQIWDVE